MIHPRKWSEEQKLETLKSSIGNVMINLKILVNSPLASQLGLVNEEEKEILLKAAEVTVNILKRAKEKGIIK